MAMVGVEVVIIVVDAEVNIYKYELPFARRASPRYDVADVAPHAEAGW